jgi:hypothetical protein
MRNLHASSSKLPTVRSSESCTLTYPCLELFSYYWRECASIRATVLLRSASGDNKEEQKAFSLVNDRWTPSFRQPFASARENFTATIRLFSQLRYSSALHASIVPLIARNSKLLRVHPLNQPLNPIFFLELPLYRSIVRTNAFAISAMVFLETSFFRIYI